MIKYETTVLPANKLQMEQVNQVESHSRPVNETLWFIKGYDKIGLGERFF